MHSTYWGVVKALCKAGDGSSSPSKITPITRLMYVTAVPISAVATTASSPPPPPSKINETKYNYFGATSFFRSL